MNKLQFYVGVFAFTGFSVFIAFCLTVLHFPDGGMISIQGPWNINVNAQIGGNHSQNLKFLPPEDTSRDTK